MKLLLLFIISTCLLTSKFAQAQDSMVKNNRPRESASSVSIDSSGPKAVATAAMPGSVKAANSVSDTGLLIITFMPVLLAIAAFSFFLNWLKKEHYKLSDALSGCDPVTLVSKTTTTMTTQGSPNPPLATAPPAALPNQSTEVANTTDTLPKSTSRLIAFMTGVTAIICSLSFMTLFIYSHLFGTDATLNFDGIWKILAGLGVGTIPYGFNMWKERSASNQAA
jgi:hypothetical protein